MCFAGIAASKTGVDPISNAILGIFLMDTSTLHAVEGGTRSSNTMFVPMPAFDQAEWTFQCVDDIV